MERINDVKDPIVGETYLVMCIRVKCTDWTPVMGVPHNDAPYGFGDFWHMHYDFRFLPQDAMNELLNTAKSDPEPTCSVPTPMGVAFPVSDTVEARWMELKMVRPMPLFKVEACGFMLSSLQKAFRHQKIDPQHPICPHRQVCLNGTAKERGALVCPAHGLRWHEKTGKMIAKRLRPDMYAGDSEPEQGSAPKLRFV